MDWHKFCILNLKNDHKIVESFLTGVAGSREAISSHFITSAQVYSLFLKMLQVLQARTYLSLSLSQSLSMRLAALYLAYKQLGPLPCVAICSHNLKSITIPFSHLQPYLFYMNQYKYLCSFQTSFFISRQKKISLLSMEHCPAGVVKCDAPKWIKLW